MRSAKEDIPNAEQVDRLLHDIKLTRQQKIALLMQSLNKGDTVFKQKVRNYSGTCECRCLARERRRGKGKGKQFVVKSNSARALGLLRTLDFIV
jgi:hypothetical protein